MERVTQMWLEIGALSCSFALFYCPKASSLWSSPPVARQSESGDKKSENKSEQLPNTKIKFRILRMSTGILEDGTLTHSITYSASDGGTLTQTSARFDNAADAEAALQKTMKKAVKIIAQIHISGSSERARKGILALVPSRVPHRTDIWLTWTDGPIWHFYISESFEDVLAIEDIDPKIIRGEIK